MILEVTTQEYSKIPHLIKVKGKTNISSVKRIVHGGFLNYELSRVSPQIIYLSLDS